MKCTPGSEQQLIELFDRATIQSAIPSTYVCLLHCITVWVMFDNDTISDEIYTMTLTIWLLKANVTNIQALSTVA